MKPLLALLLMVAMPVCHAGDPSGQDERTSDCVRKIEQAFRTPLSNPPDFATVHDATHWLKERLPASARPHFAAAGQAVSRSLKDWERSGVIHGPFWNRQALSELLIAQSPRFNGAAGCRLDDELGATREIVQDRIYILLGRTNESLRQALAKNDVADPFDARMMLMYGTILDFAGIAWTDEALAGVVKFRLPLPDDQP